MERALIIHKYWIDLILRGHKTLEMRSRRTNIRGSIGLIEAGTGLIKGKCDLVDSLGPISPELRSDYFSWLRIPDGPAGLADKYCYPWVLKNAVRFDDPIPYDHPKGAVIWVKLDKNEESKS